MIDLKETGLQFRRLRLAAGLSQTEMGAAIGIKAAGYNHLEQGRSITLKNFISLCEYHKVSPNTVLKWSN